MSEIETYASAQRLAEEVKCLLDAGKLVKGEFPAERTSIDRKCKKTFVPFIEEKARGGRGGVTRLYLVAAIPGLPNALREQFGKSAVANQIAVQIGAQSAKQHKDTVQRTKEEENFYKEHCLAQFNALPIERQKAARAKFSVLQACELFLKGGGYIGRMKEGKKTWNTKGLHQFTKAVISDSTMLEPWVYEELERKGETSLGWRSVLRWRDQYAETGLFGLADKFISKMETSLTKAHRDLIIACICDHPHITSKKLLMATEARFKDDLEIPSIWVINRFANKWKEDNAEQYLFLTNPDEWKNKYMFAIGDASELVIRLNQLWQADSTPGDMLLTDGRHAIIGIIDVYSRRLRLLVTPTSKSAAIAALLRRCILEWGVPEALKTDNGQDYVAIYLEALLKDLDIDHLLCKPFSPEEKPHIERALQTMSHGLMELLPGYIGHSVADRKAIEARSSFAKRLMSKGETVEVKMTSIELQRTLDRWTDAMYMQDPHAGLDGKTPAEMAQAWSQPIRRITNDHALDILLLPAPDRGGMRKIGKEGIKLTYGAAKLEYWAEEFAGHSGEYVRVCPDLSDLGHASITLSSGEFLCWAEDPTWYGISRAEAGKHLRNKQKKLMSEGKKELDKLAREQKTREIAGEILVDREEKLRKASENVIELPKRVIEYTTTALDQAARAVDIRENGRILPSPTLTAEQIETRERIKADMERKATSNVIGLETESARSRYRRFKAMRNMLTAGAMGYEGLLSEEDYKSLVQYEKGSEYKAVKDLMEGVSEKK